MQRAFMLWVLIATGSAAQPHVGKKFTKIFNGKDLTGWRGDTTYWRVANETLIGEVTPATLLRQNSFIIWQGDVPQDFVLQVDYWISAQGNSGINYRSIELPGQPFALKGYQADIDGAGQWNGQNYEERGREFLALRGQRTIIDSVGQRTITQIDSKEKLQTYIRPEDWNTYTLVVKGNVLRHYINHVLMSEVLDGDSVAPTDGFLGVQVHVGPPMRVAFRNFKLKRI
jgi:hypothetical protein